MLPPQICSSYQAESNIFHPTKKRDNNAQHQSHDRKNGKVDQIQSLFSKSFFQEHHQSVKQFGSTSDLIWVQTICKGCQQANRRDRGQRFGPKCEKTYLRGFANNTGADQPAPLLFACWKVAYVNLLQVKFQFSSLSL